jgi:sulfatase maturation enzyme AslB (radical SAM superfamily)
MACSYCFSGSDKTSPVVLEDELFLQAAGWVVENCRPKGKDFVLVIHGGGEPTVHMEKVKRFHGAARSLARHHDVGFFSYIATSGLLSREDAVWLARNFSRVGLSCDGPPLYQDRQRPRAGGGATSAGVEQSARIIGAEGGRMSMRATVTPDSLDGLESIVRYGREALGIRDIRVEPVYRQERSGFVPADARRFVESFLRARKLADTLGVDLGFSGARPREIHGPFCQILRNVLQLNPDGTLSSCFLAMEEGDPRIIGRARGRGGRLSVRRIALGSMTGRLALIPARCLDCVNRVHCARNCPDKCPLDAREGRERDGRGAKAEGFRCRVQRALTEQWIMDNAVDVPLPAESGGMR